MAMTSSVSRDPIPIESLGARSLRALAKMLDLTLIFLVCWALFAAKIVTSFFGIFGAFLLLAILWDAAIPGRSIGKVLFRLQVVSERTLRPCSALQAIGRNASFLFLPILDWGFILARDRRRVGDSLCSTAVLKDWKVSLLPDTSQATLDQTAAPRFFETVATFQDPIEAGLVRGRLEAEGIPAIVADANLISTHSLISNAIGGVKVQVPPEHLELAQAICEAIKNGELALDDPQ